MSNWPLIAATRMEVLGATTGDGATASATTANTKGGYTTIGTAGFRHAGILLSLTPGAADRFRIDLAINTGGSDVIIVPDFFVDLAGGAAFNAGIFLPVRIPVGAAIKARHQASGANRSLQALVTGFAADFPGAPPAQRMLSLTDWGSSTLPANIATQTGQTYTAWTEIQASTPGRVSNLWATLTGAGDTSRTASQMLVDIGFGASGSERVLGSFVAKQNTGTLFSSIYSLPCDIPAGSRLAFRVQCSAAGAADSIAVACMGLAA